MNCMKCGVEIPEQQVFCDHCLQIMEQYPVKPDAHIHLPKRAGVEVHIEHAESLAECKKMLLLAKAGKKNGCLIEGMACPGGCIAGAGTNIALGQAARELAKFKADAQQKLPEATEE